MADLVQLKNGAFIVKPGTWEPDNYVKICPVCQKSFGLTLRRHHCRFCSKIYCSKDLPHRHDATTLGHEKQALCCESCNQIILKSLGDRAQTKEPAKILSGGQQPTSTSTSTSTTSTLSVSTETPLPQGPVKLYGFPLSSNARVVQFLLELEGIRYDYVTVDLSKGEQKKPEFLKINPLGQVPVLQDGEQSIFESFAILRYLAQRNQSSLYPTDLKEQALVEQGLEYFRGEITSNCTTISFHGFVHKLFSIPSNEVELKQGKEKLNAALSHLEKNYFKESSSFLLLGKRTLLDLILPVHLEQAVLGGWQLSETSYPKIASHWNSWKSDPKYSKIHQALKALQAQGSTTTTPKSEKMTLYGFVASPNSRVISVLLEHLGIEHNFISVDLGKGDQRKPDFLKINPLGQVPVLVHGNLVLRESYAILRYLASNTGLYPEKDITTVGRIDEGLEYFRTEVNSNTGSIFLNAVLCKILNFSPDEQALENAKKGIAIACSFLERTFLKESEEFLLGKEMTLLDIALPCHFEQASLSGWTVNQTAFPKLAKYIELNKKKPAFLKVHEPFWAFFSKPIKIKATDEQPTSPAPKTEEPQPQPQPKLSDLKKESIKNPEIKLTSTKVKFYGFPGSPNSRVVQLLLEFEQIHHDFVVVDLVNEEQKKPEFLKLNPKGEIPVLVDGQVSIRESFAILRHLSSKYNSKFYPNDFHYQARVDELLEYFRGDLNIHTTSIFLNGVLCHILGFPGDESALSSAHKYLSRSLTFLETNYFKDSCHLIGTSRTLCDLALVSHLEQAAISKWVIDQNTYPKLTRWWVNFKNDPIFRKANQPFWTFFKSSPENGIANHQQQPSPPIKPIEKSNNEQLSEQKPKLYGVPLSPFSRIVTLVLEECIGSDNYQYITVDLSSPTGKTPDFLSANPRGQVPAFVHGSLKLAESFAIIRFITTKYNSPLYPNDSLFQARVDELMEYFRSEVTPQIGAIFFSKILSPVFDQEKYQDAIEKLNQALNYINDRYFQESPHFLIGSTLTVVDLILPTLLEQVSLAGWSPTPSTSLHKVINQWQEIKCRPTWIKVHSPFYQVAKTLKPN